MQSVLIVCAGVCKSFLCFGIGKYIDNEIVHEGEQELHVLILGYGVVIGFSCFEVLSANGFRRVFFCLRRLDSKGSCSANISRDAHSKHIWRRPKG